MTSKFASVALLFSCVGAIGEEGSDPQGPGGGSVVTQSGAGGGIASAGGGVASTGGSGGSASGGSAGTGGGTSMQPTCTGEATGWLPKGSTQLADLCSRGYGDPITKAFCATTTPTVTSLDDVLKTIGLPFGPGPFVQGGSSGVNGNPGFILTAQSTSITTRKVSQLNPRTVIFTPPLSRGRVTGPLKPNPSYVALGFARGDREIELLAKDPTMNGGQGDIRFFLLKYTLACDATPAGCNNADLYTAAVESGFTSWSLYDDQDLKDTTLDCLQCHQPNGPGTTRILRMQELERPWQHWMYADSPGIAGLHADFYSAHSMTENYGGIPAAALTHGDVQQLEAFIENNGFMNQPNEFKGATILTEVTATGSSATWQTQYQASQSGTDIPVPYFGSSAADPVKLANLAAQYAGVVAGTLPPTQLGDVSDVFSDTTQRAMTHKPALGLDGRQLLVQVCQQCHNSRLDQTISRATFNVETLDTLPAPVKNEAIRRINLAKNDCSHMPPDRFRELDAAEIALIQAELSK